MANIPISDRAARDFGRLITRLMELGDMSQSELATRTNISRQFISQITRGYIPSPDVVQKLAHALRVSVFELWMAAYHEVLPEGYALTPSEATEPEQRPIAEFLAKHPDFARIYHAYMALPARERERTTEFIEAALYGQRARK